MKMKTVIKMSIVALLLLLHSCLDFNSLNAGGDTTESGNFISGIVLAGSEPAKDTKVYLYKQNAAVTPAVFIKTDSTTADEEGKYSIELTEEATVYLSAKQNSVEYKITNEFAYVPSDGFEVAAIDISTKPIINKEAIVKK